MKHGANEQLSPVGGCYGGANEHLAVVGVHLSHHWIIRMNVLDADNLRKTESTEQIHHQTLLELSLKDTSKPTSDPGGSLASYRKTFHALG